MANKTVRTLGDVARFGLQLRLTCAACGRVRDVSANSLMQRFRADTNWRSIGERLRCRGVDLVGDGCGHLGALVTLLTADPDPDPPGAPSPGGGNVVPLRPRGIAPDQAQPARRRAARGSRRGRAGRRG